MRAVIQRVSEARVQVGETTVGQIQHGLLILLGISDQDIPDDAIALARKVFGLRIFTNAAGKMDLNVNEVGGGALVVSQFTLYGDCSKGRRPNFTQAARPQQAEPLYELFCSELRRQGLANVEQGQFGAMMQVHLCNDGPVTLIAESQAERTS